MKQIYAGIGSRNTPQDILDKFFEIGKFLAQKKYVLRSGGAEGADSFFEKGCDSGDGEKEIYLPWKGFNGNKSSLYNPSLGTELIVKLVHPNFNGLTNGALRLHKRNVHQILGQDLNTPVDFVICYTENGETKGGTATAIQIAKNLNIDVFNFGSDGYEKLKNRLYDYYYAIKTN